MLLMVAVAGKKVVATENRFNLVETSHAASHIYKYKKATQLGLPFLVRLFNYFFDLNRSLSNLVISKVIS